MTLLYNSQVHFQYAFVKDIIRYQNVGKIGSGINGFHAISLHRKRIIWTMLTQFFNPNSRLSIKYDNIFFFSFNLKNEQYSSYYEQRVY
jgi:hypothetical protein